jgi:hypothetical protein
MLGNKAGMVILLGMKEEPVILVNGPINVFNPCRLGIELRVKSRVITYLHTLLRH